MSAEAEEARGSGGLGQLPRLLRFVTRDMGAIAQAVREIPEITEHLAVIRKEVRGVHHETAKMRAGVEEMIDHVTKLEDEIVKLRRTFKPVRRTVERIGRVGRRPVEGDLEDHEPALPVEEPPEAPADRASGSGAAT